jgi:hypothetical protein
LIDIGTIFSGMQSTIFDAKRRYCSANALISPDFNVAYVCILLILVGCLVVNRRGDKYTHKKCDYLRDASHLIKFNLVVIVFDY